MAARWLVVRWRRMRFTEITHSIGEPSPSHWTNLGFTPAI